MRAVDGPLLITVTVQDACCPEVTVAVVGTLLTARSAAAVMAVVALAVRPSGMPGCGSGSAVGDAAVAVFTIEDPSKPGSTAAATKTWIRATSPGASAPMSQASTAAVIAQLPWVEDTDAPTTAAGIGSVSCTFWAVDGPALTRAKVQLIGSPARAAVGPDLVRVRSASPVTSVVARCRCCCPGRDQESGTTPTPS